MEPFECGGVWWVADNPTDRVAGTLSLSQKDGLKLVLLGTLGAPESPFSFSSKGYPVILGSVYDCPFGQAVTLKDCQRVRYSTGVPGLSTEGYRADRAFFGRHLVRPE